MKKIASLVIGFFIMSFSVNAASVTVEETLIYGNYGKSYIFVVENVEFSVFPDGQFDFTYLGPNNNTSVTFSSANVNISYNSGHDYDMYVQYDDYGAIIQVENVPVYYDEFGRIAQVGDVEIRYSNRRIVRVGGLYVHYNYNGYYSHYTGYINTFNYYYVFQPWHTYYVRPVYAGCVVYDYPYRRYYSPTRYAYNDHYNYYSNRGRSNVSYANGRRSFHRPGSRVHYKGGRSVANRDYNPNRRNTAVAQSNRRGQSNSKRTNTSTLSRTSNRTQNNYATNNSSSRRVESNSNTKGYRGNTSSNTKTQKTSHKKNVSQKKNNTKYSSANKTTSSISSNNSKRSYSNDKNNSKKIASNSQRKISKENSSNSKESSSKKGRRL